MEHFSFLQEITVVFILSSFVIFLFNKMKLPSILGFIITGLLAGPYGFKLVSEVEQVNLISEIGIILLLFTIGLEFSLKRLNKIKDIFFYGGSLQVFGTIILTFTAAYFILGFSVKLSLVISFIISLSSTAIVLKIFQEQGETQTPHGNISVGILIFQDITVVIMLLLIPYLSAGAQADFAGIAYALLKSALIILGFFLVARKIVPKLIYEVLKLQNNELFLIFSLSICFIIAFIADKAGLSLAFGAFLAGIIISESEYSHHVFENIMPFKEVFVSFFFISIGMLLNINFFLQKPFTILALTLLIMFFKCIIVVLGMRIIKIPLKAAFLAGISLSQIGEFSFLLTRFAYENGILSDAIFQYLISSTIITMMLSILLIKEMHVLVGWLDRFITFDALEKGGKKPVSSLKNHVIIIGYGISGKNLVKSCKTFNIPYVIIEFNPKTVRYYS
ncbi:cation:proton antiporter, partial [Flexistipes sinusarabici]